MLGLGTSRLGGGKPGEAQIDTALAALPEPATKAEIKAALLANGIYRPEQAPPAATVPPGVGSRPGIPQFTIQPRITPLSGQAGETFTAYNGEASNAISYARRWLLNGTAVGTGSTITPEVDGSLVLEVTAIGQGGSTVAAAAAATVTATSAPTLQALTASNPIRLPEDAPQGAVAGTLKGLTPGSTVILASTFGGRLALGERRETEVDLVRGATALDFDNPRLDNPYWFTVRETLADATNSLRETTFPFRTDNVFEQPKLGDLSLDGPEISTGVGSTITIIGATSGSTITVESGAIPAGMTLNNGSRTISGTPDTPGDYSFTLRETLADSPNSPRNSRFSITVTDGSEDAVAPTDLSVSSSTFDETALYGGDLAFAEAASTAPVKWSLDDDAGGWAEITPSGRLRFKGFPGTASKTIILRATNAAGFATLKQTFTYVAASSQGLFARWDTSDESKITLVNGAVSRWVDRINGFVLEAPTTSLRPAYTAAAQNGHGKVAFPLSPKILRATADPINHPLRALMNPANPQWTAMVVLKTNTSKPNGDVMTWASTTNSDTGASRNYVIVRAWGHYIAGDVTNAPAALTYTGTLPYVAPTDRPTIWSAKSDGETANQAIDLVHGGGAPAVRDGAKIVDTFQIGTRLGGSNTQGMDGDVFAVLIWNRHLSHAEEDAAMRSLAQEYAIDFGEEDPVYFDDTDYELTWEDDFEDPVPYETNAAKYLGEMSRPWVPKLVDANQVSVGSTGAVADEIAAYVDPNIEGMTDYSAFAVENSVLKITPYPRPPEFSGVSLPNRNGQKVTAFSGALAAYGRGAAQGAGRQYGYWEWRFKSPPSQAGNFPALWLLSKNGRWPTEIDAYEMFGAGEATTWHGATHQDPYWPLTPGGDTGNSPHGAKANVANHTTAFHLIGVDVHPDTGIRFYFDRKLVGTIPPQNGIANPVVLNGGSGLIADNGTSNGTLDIKSTGAKEAIVRLTVVGGVATAAELRRCGAQVPADATWTRVRNPSDGAIGGGTFSLGFDKISNDPALSQCFNTPMYPIINFALGAFTGTPTFPAGSFEVDYVRVYRRVLKAPALLTGTQAETTAIIDRMTANRATPSASAQTAINDFVRQAKSWDNLRHDTVPMGPHTSDWDVTKLSLWDALEGFFLFDVDASGQALVNWKAPGTAPTVNGSPVFTAGQGYAFSGVVGQCIDTNVSVAASNLWRVWDAHFGVVMTAPTNPALASVMGASTSRAMLQVSATTHNYRINQDGDSSYRMTLDAPGAGHLVACRGWRYQQHCFLDGELFSAGSTGSGVMTDVANMLIGARHPTTAGAACTIAAAHWGRRLMPDEVAKLHELLTELRGSW